MIKRHQKISYLRKDLARTSAGRWLSQAPGSFVEGVLSSQAALASWVTEVKPELLGKPSLGVLVLGSMIEGIDSGAWWTLFPTMLEKSVDWAKITVMVPSDEGIIEKTGLVPASLSKSIKIVRGNMTALDQIDANGIDVVYLPFGNADAWINILGGEKNNLWKFLDQKASLVIGLLDPSETNLSIDIAKQYGVENIRQIKNRFYEPVADAIGQSMILISVQGQTPADLEMADDHATNLSEVMDVIMESADVFNGVEVEDYRLWGMCSSIKSSLDSNDKYISLPKKLAVRMSNGFVYHIEDDLAVGESLRIAFDEESLKNYPGMDSHWTERVFWAGRAWQSGLGEYYNKTLGAVFNQIGFSKPGMSEFFNRLGIEPSNDLERMKNAMTGGDKYSPTRDERMLFDLVDQRDEKAILEFVDKKPNLLDSFNEDRLPLLVMLGVRNLPGVMAKVIALGANANACDGGDRPVIVELSGRGNKEVVEVLLGAGVDPNCQDAMGWTPLLYSLKAKQWGIVQALLDAGADPRIENSLGMSPRRIAFDEKSEIDVMMDKNINIMKNFMDSDKFETIKKISMGIKSSDIPKEIRERLI